MNAVNYISYQSIYSLTLYMSDPTMSNLLSSPLLSSPLSCWYSR